MRPEFDNTEDWHNRGYLPHYDSANKYQMITYRLNDSLPAGSARGSRAKADGFTESDIEYRKRIESLLDKGYGSCVLNNPRIAKLVIDNWKNFDGERYDLIAYVVMPNHVHVLIKTYREWSLSKVLHSWKSYTSHEMRKILEEEKFNASEPDALPAWQEECWDRFIRDERHYYRAIKYIHENPVKAGLCAETSDWKWSSANDERFRESND